MSAHYRDSPEWSDRSLGCEMWCSRPVDSTAKKHWGIGQGGSHRVHVAHCGANVKGRENSTGESGIGDWIEDCGRESGCGRARREEDRRKEKEKERG